MSHHERTDARVEVIPWAVLVFVVCGIVIFAAVWWIFKFYRRIDMLQDDRRTLIEQPSPIPPEPRLQIDSEEDLLRYRQEQSRSLGGYGWVSPAEQRVRIPIERAMELVAKGKQP